MVTNELGWKQEQSLRRTRTIKKESDISVEGKSNEFDTVMHDHDACQDLPFSVSPKTDQCGVASASLLEVAAGPVKPKTMNKRKHKNEASEPCEST